MTILSETFIERSPSITIVIVAPLFIFLLGHICGCMFDKKPFTKSAGKLSYIIPGVIAITCLAMLLMMHFTSDSYTKVEATINNEVSFTTIVDEYEFIEKRGDIFVFKRR